MISLILISLSQISGNTPIWQVSLEEHEIFERTSLAVGIDNICIVDAKKRQLLFIDVKTKTIHREGRKGEGPGEFSFIGEVKWCSTDEAFYAWDPSRNMISKYSRHGKFEKRFRLQKRPDGFSMAPKQNILTIMDNNGIKGSAPTIMLIGLESGEEKKIHKNPALKENVGLHISEPDLTVSMKFKWDSGLVIGGDTYYSAFIYSDKPIMTLIDHKNMKISEIFTFKLKRYPLTEEDVDRRFSGPAAGFRGRVEPHLQLPEYWPYVGKVFVDGDCVWIVSPSPPSKKGAYYSKYRRNGTFLSQGEFKNNPMDISHGFVYWIANYSDELTLEKIDFN